LISYLGDLGTIIADYRINKTGKAKLKIGNDGIDKFLAAKKFAPIKDADLTVFHKERAGIHFAPAKKEERQGTAPADLRNRKGIFESGAEADKALGKTVPKDQINEAKWPDQYILLKRLEDKTVTEPWAGHMSGSCPEVAMAWDIFTNVDPMLSIDPTKIKANAGKLDSADRKVKVALAAAMLIGLGFHSAMEVYEPTDDYLGIDHRPEILKKGGVDMPILHGKGPESTSYIEGILKSFTDKKRLYISWF
jgi:hypothetical protein